MTKIKINTSQKEVSSEEIKSRRNFDSIVKEYKTVTKPFYKKPTFIGGAGLLAAAAIVTTLYYTAPKVETSATLIPSDTNQVVEEKAFINPAFSNLEIAYENLTVDAAKGGVLKLKNGSIIRIPASAFAGEDGQPSSGKVEIRYREFRDAVDMLVSGIPMHYDSAGVKRQLESAGMFEILGYQNGKQVSLAKPISVEMTSNNSKGNFNQYYLDTLSRSWKYLGGDKIVREVKKLPITSEVAKDSFVTTNSDLPAVDNLDDKIQTIQSQIQSLKKEEPVKPQMVKVQNYRFDVDVLPEEFPELTEYKSLQFEVVPENKTFNEKLYTVEWDDVKLEYNTPGKNYKISFIKDKKTSSFTVYPVYQAKDSAKVMALYRKKFNAYEKKLNERVAAEKKAKEEQVRREEEWKKQQAKYAAEELKRSQAINYSNIRNVFAVSKFGIYNSDCPFAYDNQVSMNISFINESNQPIPVDIAYHIDYERNSLFSHYYYNSRGYKLNYNPKSTNILFTVAPNNELWVFSSDEFKNVNPVNGRYAFKMKKPEKTFTKVAELKEYLLPTKKAQ